jgi:hypothetical protein
MRAASTVGNIGSIRPGLERAVNSNHNDASSPERAGRMRYQDAGSPNSSAIWATEDAVAHRSVSLGRLKASF